MKPGLAVRRPQPFYESLESLYDMKPCRSTGVCTACHIKGRSGKHLAVAGWRFRSPEAWRTERERQRREIRMHSERKD